MELKADASNPISSAVLILARAFKSPCEIESATFASAIIGFERVPAIKVPIIVTKIEVPITKRVLF